MLTDEDITRLVKIIEKAVEGEINFTRRDIEAFVKGEVQQQLREIVEGTAGQMIAKVVAEKVHEGLVVRLEVKA
jgi:hypothetical protein